MLTNKKEKNKKGLSEIVSYVLLIVIALGLAVGVYSWMRYYLPAQNQEKCPDDVALTMKDYSCENGLLNIILENSGFFNIDGFYIRASNETGDSIPTILLNSTQAQYTVPGIPGRCNLQYEPFNVSTTRDFQFDYSSFNSLTKVQIQPYTIENNHLYMCSNIVTVDLPDCGSANGNNEGNGGQEGGEQSQATLPYISYLGTKLYISPNDSAYNVPWGCNGINVGAFSIIDGKANTKAENANLCSNQGIIAAKICYELTLEGYDDWYLPSIDQLNAIRSQLYINNITIPEEYSSKWSSLNSAWFWSSTEDIIQPNNMAESVQFDISGSGTSSWSHDKDYTYRVRCVRGGENPNINIVQTTSSSSLPYISYLGTKLYIYMNDSSGVAWGCNDINVGAYSTINGKTNTETIIANSACGSSSAAKVCADLTLEGSGWYLPSIEQLDAIKAQGYIDNITIPEAYASDWNNLTAGFYWSSTETPNTATNKAVGNRYYLEYHANDDFSKLAPYSIRCVKS